MEIHKPKPAHSLREFLTELGTIICGILIALSLEAAVEHLRWHGEVTKAREHLREEIRFDEKIYLHRVDVAACVARDAAELKTVIGRLRSGQGSAPIAQINSPENGPIRSEIWESLKAAQVLVHFPKDELEKYSRFYQARIDDEYFMDRESKAWRTLHLLEGDPKTLSHEDLSALWLAQGDAAEMGRGVALISRGQVEIGRSLGLDMPATDASWRPECQPLAAGA